MTTAQHAAWTSTLCEPCTDLAKRGETLCAPLPPALAAPRLATHLILMPAIVRPGTVLALACRPRLTLPQRLWQLPRRQLLHRTTNKRLNRTRT